MAEETLTFEESTHRYFLDGAELPSVTRILDEVGLTPQVNYPASASIRGNDIHTATHFIDENDLYWPDVPKEYLGYLKAYEKFKQDAGFVPELIEKRVYSKQHRFAGTLDRLGKADPKWLADVLRIKDSGLKLLIDIKTGEIHQYMALQLAGYALCVEEPVIRIALKLDESGTYRTVVFSDYRDKSIFISAAQIVNWKRANLR